MKQIKYLLSLVALFMMPVLTHAQCAMCRTQVVNNVSHGDTALAAGLNFGILYLFCAPYLIIGLVAFIWYRNAKVNGKKGAFEGNN